MKSPLALIILFALSGCATIGQQAYEAQFGLYKNRDFRAKVISANEDDTSLVFKDRAAIAKKALVKSAEATGKRYSDFVTPGNRLAQVLVAGRFDLNKGAAHWPVQYDPRSMNLEVGDVVITKISPAAFVLADRDHLQSGDIPLAAAIVCKANDSECLADPKRGGTLGVILKDGTAITGNSHFFGRLDNTVYE